MNASRPVWSDIIVGVNQMTLNGLALGEWAVQTLHLYGVHHKSWLPRACLQGSLKRLHLGFGVADNIQVLGQPPVDHTSGATSVGQDF